MRFGGSNIFDIDTSGGKGKKKRSSYNFSRSYEYRLAAKHAGYVSWSSFLAATLDDQAEAIAIYRVHSMREAVEAAEMDKK